jgi:glycosyltransferase involved in cell wall biosynthesis
MAGVINSFVRQGYDVHVLSLAQLEMLDPKVVLHTLEGPSRLGLPFELNNYRFHRAFVRKASRLLAEFQPAFLYHRMSVANYAGVVLSRLLQIPLVVEYNGSEAWVAKHWGTPLRYHKLAVSAEDAMLRHAHLVVTVSDVLRKELLERGLSSNRIVAYPNCIDPCMFDPQLFTDEDSLALRKSLNIQENNTVVGFIGTFGKWHGAEVLARAIRRMVDQQREWIMGRQLQFLFVGDGLQMPRVREILAPNRVAQIVRFAGLIPQAEAPRYLAACDILVSPHVPNKDGSRFFGSPTKLFEYMAMAKGIVASDLEQIGQVLKESLRVHDLPLAGEPSGNKLAVLVRPDDEKELIAGIRFLVERPDWRRHLGANARREVLARYTWDHHVNAILEGLRGVVGLQGEK